MSVRSSVNRCFASPFRRARKAMTHWRATFAERIGSPRVVWTWIGNEGNASRLEIGPKTIETHRRHIGRKFGFKTTAELRHLLSAGWT